ncbi:MAG TPA: PHP-associated domain-containing protein [Bryobacteraceae bacterium]
MRCDLHVHTDRSGMCTVPVARQFCQESYNDPLEVYWSLKKRGMDLVTITDHDSIDAAECLRRFPDFFLSEEVTCTMPSGTEVHVGVYDIAERDHIEIQKRRHDVPALIAYLRQRRLLFAVNHVFSALTGRRTDADFALFQDCFPAMETLNGHLLSACNWEAEMVSARWRKIPLGGSDSHTMAELGRAFTEAPGTRNKREFLDALKEGRARARGRSGGYWQLTRAVWSIAAHVPQQYWWGFLLAPLAAVIPLVTLGSCLHDRWFAGAWARRLNAHEQPGYGSRRPAIRATIST